MKANFIHFWWVESEKIKYKYVIFKFQIPCTTRVEVAVKNSFQKHFAIAITFSLKSVLPI